MSEPLSDLANSLAIEALQKAGRPFKVTPYLDIEQPDSIEGFRLFGQALETAYRAGLAKTLISEVVAESAPAVEPSAEKVVERNYEEFRKLLDGASESMTHEDAIQELKDLIAASRRTAGDAPKLLGQVVMYPNYSTVIRWVEGVTPPSGTLLYAAPVSAGQAGQVAMPELMDFAEKRLGLDLHGQTFADLVGLFDAAIPTESAAAPADTVSDSARRYLMSQDLYQFLTNAQNGIDSPATMQSANRLLVRLDKLRDEIATSTAAEGASKP